MHGPFLFRLIIACTVIAVCCCSMPQVPFPQRALPTKHVDSLVVGGGLSGFTTAYYLQKKGVNVMLAEARDELGGNIVSKEADGFLWEEGPNSFQPHPSILRFAKDLNILDELVWANPSLPRFIFWGDRLHALPTSAGGLLRTELLTCEWSPTTHPSPPLANPMCMQGEGSCGSYSAHWASSDGPARRRRACVRGRPGTSAKRCSSASSTRSSQVCMQAIPIS